MTKRLTPKQKEIVEKLQTSPGSYIMGEFRYTKDNRYFDDIKLYTKVGFVLIDKIVSIEADNRITAVKNVSLQRLVNQLSLSQEGIYGVPLSISASTVFLFVLLGAMLERTGGGRYFVQLAFSLLGRYKGGPAKAAIVSSGLTGLFSGSSIANVVTTGTFTIPLMKKVGYPAEIAAATEGAASTNGQLMPPIMGAAAFIIA